MAPIRPKIMSIHGITSNWKTHAFQIDPLVRALPDFDFIFPSAPHKMENWAKQPLGMPQEALDQWSAFVMKHGPDLGHRAWWYAIDGEWENPDTGGFFGIEESLREIGRLMEEHGPINVVMGTSQGACFAALICALLQDKQANHPLRKCLPKTVAFPPAGVMYGGFRPRKPAYDSLYVDKIDSPMLFTMGDDDVIVKKDRTVELQQACTNATVIEFEGGHEVPKKEVDRAKILEWLRRTVDKQRSLQNGSNTDA